MRILADSNMFIDFWRNATQSVVDVFTTEDIVICGVVRCELLHGAKSDKDFKNINTVLDAFEEVPFEESDWDQLGKLLYQLRTKGITVPLSDAIIAHVAIKNRIPVWTKDQHFLYMQQVLKDLQVMTFAEEKKD